MRLLIDPNIILYAINVHEELTMRTIRLIEETFLVLQRFSEGKKTRIDVLCSKCPFLPMETGVNNEDEKENS